MSPSTSELKLHVPSPDWRDQVVYFLMTDRFEDGDPSNNDQRAGVFDPSRSDRYSGGDLAGVLKRLDYIRGLGASAVWITPPVANQWKSRSDGYTGYHGYWAEHFMEVDRHLGTLQDYRRLSDGLHRRGMYLIQDIVVNHTGDFFWYGQGWRAGQPAQDYRYNLGSQPVKRPRQWPFSLNDPRRAADRKAGVYHWTPDIKNYTDRQQELNFQMSGLDDLNTEKPVVREALRRSYGHWIREVGVDGFRVDTAFYVPPEYFEDFLDARGRHPGMRPVARATGRRDFFTFGEGFGIDKPGEDVQSRRIESYIARPGTETATPGATQGPGSRRLDGMLNFPLYGALTDVYARGLPTAVLGDRIERMVRNHPRLHWMPTFVDNHDVDRFLAGGSDRGLRQALASIFTLPGIPTVYYGTEQGFRTQRASMFAAGWGSGGRDRFDTAAPLYRHIAELAQLRRQHPVFSRGLPTVLRADESGPGAIVWRMDAAGPGTRAALVALNTAEHPVLVDGLTLGDGARHGDGAPVRLVPLWRDGGTTPATPSAATEPAMGAAVDIVLAPGESRVWAIESAIEPFAAPHNGRAADAAERGLSGTLARITGPASSGTRASALAGDALPVLREPTVRLQGEGEPGAALKLVLNGRLASAVPVLVDAQGRWQAELDLSDLIDATATHHAVLWDAQRQQASARWRFRVEPAWRVVADVADPDRDDHGPAGTASRYQYPTAGWGDRGLADLRRVVVESAGGSLRVTLHLRNLSTDWNPAQGFDRVAFTLFAEVPGAAGGLRLMPLQSATLPQDLRWHRRLRLHGWSNALFDWQGAAADHEGTPVTPGARVEADAAARTVRITLPRSALGAPASLSGARLYVSTWDYDAGFRPLQTTAGPFAFGGGEPNGPKVMDDTAVITLP